MIIVLITTGKHEEVFTAEIKLFGNQKSASDYCEKVNTGRVKYWTLAQIVEDGEEISLDQPE